MDYFNSSKIYKPSELDLNQAHSDDYYELQKLATVFKDKKQWDFALACLYKAKQIAQKDGVYPELQYITRLALFLQQAGKFEESKSELKWIYEKTEHYSTYLVENLSSNQALLQKSFKLNYLSHLFDKARLIYKREKQLEEAEQFALISKQYQEEWKYINELLEQQNDFELVEYHKKIEEYELAKQQPIHIQEKCEKRASVDFQKIKEFIVGLMIVSIIIWLILK